MSSNFSAGISRKFSIKFVIDSRAGAALAVRMATFLPLPSPSSDFQNLSDATRDLSFKVGELVASLNIDLQTVATNVSQAIQSGVSVNLESMAQGMGFDSFAAAVAAYNAQYGTSFSVQQAKDALEGN